MAETMKDRVGRAGRLAGPGPGGGRPGPRRRRPDRPGAERGGRQLPQLPGGGPAGDGGAGPAVGGARRPGHRAVLRHRPLRPGRPVPAGRADLGRDGRGRRTASSTARRGDLRCSRDRHRRPRPRRLRRRAHHRAARLPRGAGPELRGHPRVARDDGRAARGPLPRAAHLRPRGTARCSRSARSAATRPCPWPPAWRPGGEIISCEISPVHAEFARRHIAASPYRRRHRGGGGAGHRHHRRPGRARSTWSSSTPTRRPTPTTSRLVLPKLAPRGLIAADNTLWSGRILDPSDTSDDTVALRRFNDALAVDPRVVVVQTTVRDGVTLIRRAG